MGVSWSHLIPIAPTNKKEGRRRRNNDSKELNSALGTAKGIAKEEMQQPLFQRSKYYKMAMRPLSMDGNNWIYIKRDVSSSMGRPVTNAQVCRTLETLSKMGIIDKTGAEGYDVIDPVVKEFAKEL